MYCTLRFRAVELTTLNIALLGRQPKFFLALFLSLSVFFMFVFSDIGLLVLSVIGVSSWLFTFRTREHRYWRGSVYVEHYKSRVSHLQVGRVS